jgi:hypothetical protein
LLGVHGLGVLVLSLAELRATDPRYSIVIVSPLLWVPALVASVGAVSGRPWSARAYDVWAIVVMLLLAASLVMADVSWSAKAFFGIAAMSLIVTFGFVVRMNDREHR